MAVIRTHSWLQIATMLLAGLVVLHLGSFTLAEESNTLQISPEVRDHLDRLTRALITEDEVARRDVIDSLRKEYGRTYGSLIPQLVWFSAHATSTAEAMVAGIVLRDLQISEALIVHALVPYLDAPDDKFRKSVRELIAVSDRGVVCGPPGYEHFEYLASEIRKAAQRSEEPPASLVRFLYDVRPGTAMLEMMRAYMAQETQTEWRRLIWAEYVVRDALWKKSHGFPQRFLEARQEVLVQLGSLSHHPKWFVRLYVATVSRKYPELRDTKIVNRLKQDPHPLVREAAEAAGP